MCVLTSPMVATPLTNDEIAAWHKFATRVARNLARHPYIDYEQCAIDGLMATLRLLPNGGPKFRGFLALKIWTVVRHAEKAEARYQAHVTCRDPQKMTGFAAPDAPDDLFDGLAPGARDVAEDLFVRKLTEEETARKHGMTRWQVRNKITKLRELLEANMGDDR
jgi:hypothetical protein